MMRQSCRLRHKLKAPRPGEARMLVVRFGKVQRHDTLSVDHGRVALHQRVPTLLGCSEVARQPIARAGDDLVTVRRTQQISVIMYLRRRSVKRGAEVMAAEVPATDGSEGGACRVSARHAESQLACPAVSISWATCRDSRLSPGQGAPDLLCGVHLPPSSHAALRATPYSYSPAPITCSTSPPVRPWSRIPLLVCTASRFCSCLGSRPRPARTQGGANLPATWTPIPFRLIVACSTANLRVSAALHRHHHACTAVTARHRAAPLYHGSIDADLLSLAQHSVPPPRRAPSPDVVAAPLWIRHHVHSSLLAATPPGSEPPTVP
ncbi:hypothetical protein BDU57DRAFT_219744 [Ampelomyces quisqualis]|uniref:Uncharacterized protein n=1 Tax=Ampelomyces quisqualis TaxID=50730 RepID=A0A6A5QL53_AMPQU|nr:hypothetical protein BDU57DRAFT_219744 [Ampelomyces quisqualis]